MRGGIARWWMAATFCVATGLVGGAEPTLDLELVTQDGFRGDLAKQWYKLFDELNLRNVRIRGIQPGDGVTIEPIGNPVRSYRIVGVLTSQNQLKLAGGTFSVHDKAKIGTWLAKVKEGGVEGLLDKPAAFGLLERQFAELKQSLASKTTFSTKDETPAAIVEKLVAGVRDPIQISAAAREKLAAAEKFPDELLGMSTGAALAAALRPAGLVLLPEKAGQGTRLSIVDARDVKEPWPVGWPIDRPAKDYIPELLSFLNVEIEDTPLAEVVTAIQGRLKVPFVIDQNSLARERVDLATAKVTLPTMRIYYQKVLERALFAAKLKMEVRIDEAGQPFVWITTIKR